MRIKTAWLMEDDGPFLLSAYDENTFEAWGEEPEWYQKEIDRGVTCKESRSKVRELWLHVDDAVLTAIFETPNTVAIVKGIDQ